jgi:hypothetical protein
MTLAFFDLDRAISKSKLPGTLLDSLSILTDAVSGAIGTFSTAVSAIGDFKDATFSQLNAAVTAARRARQATIALRDTFCSLPLDVATFRNDAKEAIVFLTSQITCETSSRQLLDSFETVERSAAVTKAGRTRTTYVARDGDTWEGISMIYYFDPSRGNDVRDANAVVAGAPPTPGVEYVVPV